MTSGGGTQVLAGHGDIHGPGHQAVLADTNGDALIYHYYATTAPPCSASTSTAKGAAMHMHH